MKGILSVLVGAALFLAVMWWAIHFPEGPARFWRFGLAVALFALFAFGPGRLWGKSLNDKSGQ